MTSQNLDPRVKYLTRTQLIGSSLGLLKVISTASSPDKPHLCGGIQNISLLLQSYVSMHGNIDVPEGERCYRYFRCYGTCMW